MNWWFQKDWGGIKKGTRVTYLFQDKRFYYFCIYDSGEKLQLTKQLFEELLKKKWEK